ncbi:MAG: hypothetical protein U1F46_08840 [Marinagarivorans sp.]
MNTHIELDRRFQHITKISEDELSSLSYDRKKLTWDDVLENRFSIIVGRANFGKTEELKAKARALRGEGKSAVYIALWEVLNENNFSDALEAKEREALEEWRQKGGALTVFVDSLDEASLGFQNGIKKALRRVVSEVGNSKPHIQWVFSSRPAILTPEVCTLIEVELGAFFFTNAEANDNTASPVNQVFGLNSISSPDKIKIFRLMPLDHSAAIRYLDIKYFNNVDLAKKAIKSAGEYGIESLRDGPGGLDILAHIDLVGDPPQCLTEIYEKIIGAVQQQQRTDPRETSVASPRPEDMDQAIQRLACASVLCQLPNIEISSEALNYQANVLSARPILATYLTEHAIHYLLGSRLFIDSGRHQVKLYPDLLLPFLAAKYLADLVRSPAHATSLLRNFTWRASTGECGVHRSMLPLAGWLSVFSSHCRHELLRIDPQAVAFFGDLRNPNVPLADAKRAIKGAIERLVISGDSIGRGCYFLTSDNYWQAYKPGVESVLKDKFERYNVNWSAKNALLYIAICAKSDVFRINVLEELKSSADPLEVINLKRAQFYLREEQTPFRPKPQKEYPTFERDLAPEISDYKSFALAVEADLLQVKRDVEEGDFSLRRFFNSINFNRIKTDLDGLALEADFQALLGSELNHAAKNRYAVTLESTLPDNTRRDLLCERNSMRATIELKMSQRWTLPDYFEALEMQLKGQYMRDQNSKIGFLVIVLQKRRKWKRQHGETITFEELIELLQNRARENEAADSTLHLRVIAIDATQPVNFRENKSQKLIARKNK